MVAYPPGVGSDPTIAALLFDPGRLRIARALRRLGQSELAEACGVSVQAVSQWESQAGTCPTSTNLTSLAARLDLPVGFFADASPEPHPGTFFRSLRSTTATDRRLASAMAHLAHLFAIALEDEVVLPRLTVPRVDVPHDESAGAVDFVAEKIRELLAVPPGPIANVVALVERQGVVVVRADRVAPTISAFSVPYARRPVVVLGGDDNERARGRMDAAHEFVHLVLHRPDTSHPKALESQATAVGSALLLPANQFPDEVGPAVTGSRIDWRHLVVLRGRWGASIQAQLYRARSLGVITESRYTQAMKFISMKGWRKREPGSRYPPEDPVLLSRALRMAEERGSSLAEIAQRSALPAKDLEVLIIEERPSVEV